MCKLIIIIAALASAALAAAYKVVATGSVELPQAYVLNKDQCVEAGNVHPWKSRDGLVADFASGVGFEGQPIAAYVYVAQRGVIVSFCNVSGYRAKFVSRVPMVLRYRVLDDK